MDALSLEVKFPEGWNARTRCIPSPDDTETAVDKEVGKAQDRLRARCAKLNLKKGAPAIEIPSFAWNPGPLRSALKGWTKSHPNAPTEQAIRDARKKLKLQVFAATPVDKYSADGRLM